MNLSKILKNGILVLIASLVLSACATQKKTTTGQIQSDVYTGSD
jgi:peptidoglycan-associated lipoprotein